MPAPSPSALVGLAVLVLIAVGVVHLSGSGSAVPLEVASAPVQQSSAGQGAGEPPAGDPVADATGTPAPAEGSPPAETSSSAPEPSAGIAVHVSGAVADPGVVELPGGARVDDALEAAGGATEEADLAAVNLARPLVDGEQVHVPVPGEEPRPAPVGDSSSSRGSADPAAPAEATDGSPIDLNSADASQLEELPGVGPAIAQRIVEHREKNGPFTSVDGLLEVSGIGPATLEEIRGRATV